MNKNTRINTSVTEGLTSEQVREKVSLGLVNQKVSSSTQTTKSIIYSNVFTYFNFIFLVLSLLLIMVGSYKNLTFLPIIISNTMIGIVQELRSKKVLDKLSILNAPHVLVVRNGNKETIDAENAVQDDIAIFSAGNQICADATVLYGEIAVNESLLTGEADEVIKNAGDKLLSGSFVISGECYCRLDQVGEESYISQLTLKATTSNKKEQSEMIRSLDKLVKMVGIAIIPIGLIMVAQQYIFSGTSFKVSITSMVAAVIGMIPEGLYLLASVALVVSAMRLAKQQVLLHDMKCIETLARVNVLCVDKTGTITVPDMEVSGIHTLANVDENKLIGLIGDFCNAMSNDNATMDALKNSFTDNLGGNTTAVFSFSSKTKYSGAIIDNVNYVLGAPEFLLREQYEDIADTVADYSDKGYRVILFGIYNGVLDGNSLSKVVTPLCLIYLSNAIRSGAVETFNYFEECGVEIKVISGDNPKTVSEISKKAGIANAENYIDASTLSEDDIDEAMKKYTVFGRVTPDQKQLFVKSLKSQGNTVAMTGDGVNDVLALKDADCSIAMASGSEAASQVAQLVLLDSDFSRMPSVVLEGRRVVNNIQRSASLFLVKNIFSMLTAIFTILFMWTYPIEPSQISLIGCFTIGVPSFILAMEPNKERIRGHFLTNVFLKAFPAGITNFLAVIGFVACCKIFNITHESVSTSCTILLAIIGFMILYRIAQPMTKIHVALIVAMIIGLVFTMLVLGNIFSIRMLTKQTAIITLVFAAIAGPIVNLIYNLCNKIYEKRLG